MQVVEQTVVIDAPIHVVMNALNQVERIPDWATVPGVIDRVEGQGVGMTYHWHYHISGLHFKGQSKVIEQTETTLITKTSGDVHSIWTINLTPVGKDNTLIQVVVEYTRSGAFLEPLADFVVQQLTKPEVAEENMQRFKQAVEQQAHLVEKEKALAE